MIIYGYRIFVPLGGNKCHSRVRVNDKRVLEKKRSLKDMLDFVFVSVSHIGPIGLFLVPASVTKVVVCFNLPVG